MTTATLPIWLVQVFDILGDRPTTARICYESALMDTHDMLRREYPDRERFKIFWLVAHQAVGPVEHVLPSALSRLEEIEKIASAAHDELERQGTAPITLRTFAAILRIARAKP